MKVVTAAKWTLQNKSMFLLLLFLKNTFLDCILFSEKILMLRDVCNK